MRYTRLKFFSILSLVFLFGIGCSSLFPNYTEFIDDRIGILNRSEKRRIYAYYKELLKELDVHLKVVVFKEASLDIDRAAVELFDQYALGEKTRGARGLLLAIDPKGEQVRIEIGYDLEPIFPDSLVGSIERDQMRPFFQSGKVGAGIEASVELLVAKALGTDKFSTISSGQAIPESEKFSGGAGAKIPVKIGSEQLEKMSDVRADLIRAQQTPDMALETYIQVLQLKIKDPNLDLYTPETRQFFKKWLVTDGQQANELKQLQENKPKKMLFHKEKLAVIRFPIENRQTPPYFFRQGEKGWMIDFASLGQLVGFNHKNQWHFRRLDNEFIFAFKDLEFDEHGFPHAKKQSEKGIVNSVSGIDSVE